MPSRTRGLQPPTTRQLVTLANVAVVACCCIFVWLHLQPHLLLRNTTPAGGDMGAHVWGPAYLRHNLLPSGRITGWTMDWYDGFPALTFYFPLPSLMIALLSFVLPYGIAFKLITVLGLVSLPASAAAFGVLTGMRRPYAACLAVATVPFLFDRGWTIYGGNVGSTLAGEFSFSISLSFALLFLGVLARSLDTGKHRGWAIVLLGCTLLCHILPTIFAIVAAVVMVLIWPRVKRIGLAASVGVLGLALTGFWLVPFAVRLPLTNDMGWEKVERYGLPLVGSSLGGPEKALLWLSLPVAVAIAVYVTAILRSRWFVGGALALVAGASLAALGASTVIVRLFDQKGTDADLSTIGQTGLDPTALRLLFYAALGGAVVSLLRSRRLGTILTYTALMAALAFRFMPGPTAKDPNAHGKLWNARMLPFWYLCLYLLGGVAVTELGPAIGRWVATDPENPSPLGRLLTPVVAGVAVWMLVGLPLGVLPGLDVLPGLPAWDFGWLFDRPGLAKALGAALLVIAIVFGFWVHQRVRAFKARVRQAFTVMREPPTYVRRVASWQACDWALRFVTIWFFLRAFGIPDSVRNVFLVQATSSLATLAPVTPGGLGTEQAFLVYAFRGTVGRTRLLAFSVGMKVTLTVVNVVLGFAAIFIVLRTFRFRKIVDQPEVTQPEAG